MRSKYQLMETLDVKGRSYPMPIVDTKRVINDLGSGDVLEEITDDEDCRREI